MAPRIVVGRAAHLGYEERELVQLELLKRLAEVELAREPEAVHRAPAVLAEIDLVHVRVHELVLVVAQLERNRHERLAQLARPAALVAQEIATHELLRERARALAYLSGSDVDEGGTEHCDDVDAVVLLEAPVFDGFERLGQQRRYVGRRDDEPVLAVRGKQAADWQWVEAHDRGVRALRVPDRCDAAVRERERHEPLGLRVAGEVEAARGHLEAREPDPIRAGARQTR